LTKRAVIKQLFLDDPNQELVKRVVYSIRHLLKRWRNDEFQAFLMKNLHFGVTRANLHVYFQLFGSCVFYNSEKTEIVDFQEKEFASKNKLFDYLFQNFFKNRKETKLFGSQRVPVNKKEYTGDKGIFRSWANAGLIKLEQAKPSKFSKQSPKRNNVQEKVTVLLPKMAWGLSYWRRTKDKYPNGDYVLEGCVEDYWNLNDFQNSLYTYLDLDDDTVFTYYNLPMVNFPIDTDIELISLLEALFKRVYGLGFEFHLNMILDYLKTTQPEVLK